MTSTPAVLGTVANQPERKTDSALSQLTADSDTFIKMLVAQLQNQDPTNPMESTDFVSQTAQLTQVEQSIQTNRNIEALQMSIGMSAALHQTSLIGRAVTTASSTMVLDETGSAFSYALEAPAESVTALIKDGAGKVIRRIEDLPASGGEIFDVQWDGITDDGQDAPHGQYRIDLATPGGSGNYETFATSRVEAVDFAGGQPMLKLADGRYAASTDILRAE